MKCGLPKRVKGMSFLFSNKQALKYQFSGRIIKSSKGYLQQNLQFILNSINAGYVVA